MAKVLRGKGKGQQVEICQFANNWVMLDNGQICNPTSLEYTPAEITRIKNDKNTGMMFDFYKLVGNRLKKR